MCNGKKAGHWLGAFWRKQLKLRGVDADWQRKGRLPRSHDRVEPEFDLAGRTGKNNNFINHEHPSVLKEGIQWISSESPCRHTKQVCKASLDGEVRINWQPDLVQDNGPVNEAAVDRALWRLPAATSNRRDVSRQESSLPHLISNLMIIDINAAEARLALLDKQIVQKELQYEFLIKSVAQS